MSINSEKEEEEKDGFDGRAQCNMIIGPSGSGKTNYLAGLWIASFSLEDPSSCIIRARNKAMADLARSARKAAASGNPRIAIDATEKARKYSFEVEVKQPGPKKHRLIFAAPTPSPAHFRVYDGKGGALFIKDDDKLDPEDAPLREEIIETGKRANGLIICIDCVKFDDSRQFFVDLPDFLHDIGRPLPFDRICIALTKSEKLGAIKQLADRCPVEHVKKFLAHSLKQLLDYRKPTSTVACGWVSTYGFLSDGSPNCVVDPDGQDQMISLSPSIPVTERIRNWKPYQVLDPIVFLASGELGNLKNLEDR